MGPDPELELLFHEASSLSGEARKRYLDEACSNRPELRRNVERLLAANDSGALLEPRDLNRGELRTGDLVGRYRLIERLGEGGCGVVFLAEQFEPIRRRVALKVIKAGMDSRTVIARFEAERQALALMDHPNIARVFDAGTTDLARPYFVMELVRGRRITEHCDHFKLGTRERLSLFVQVCQAVQHAHQKGIIHRDLKPSNILVSVDDGVAIPKVIDFGVAKAIEQRLTEKTLVTGFHQLLGTPAYMSPEQAEFSNLDVDTRSDIYSLGVLLYELLTGHIPFEEANLFQKGLDEIRRMIREVEPPRPSTRVATLSNQEQRTLSAARGIDLPTLKRELSGDLDWVVMRCVEKDRARRYQTAGGLYQDCQRFLRNEPVQARPPTVVYRFQKIVRRHRAWALGVTAVLATIGLGLAVAGWQWRQAVYARGLAERNNYAASVSFAEQLVRSGDTVAARRLLFSLPERLRGWEWGRLMAQAHQELAEIPLKANALPNANPPDYSLTDDGSLFAWWQGDGLVRVVRVRDQNVIRVLGSTEEPVSQARFSPDGRNLLLVGPKIGWELWDVSIWTKVRSNSSASFGTVSFRPDGNQFVTCCDGLSASVWDTGTGAESLQLPLKHNVSVIYFSRNGDRLFSNYYWVQQGQTQFVWNATDGSLIAEIPPDPFKYVQLSIAATGDRYATGDTNDVAAFWKVGAEKPEFETPRQGDDSQSITAVAASSDFPRLAAICAPGQLHIWNCETGMEMRPIDGLSYSMWPTPDGTSIVTTSLGFQLRVWSWYDGSEQYRLSGGRGSLGSVAEITQNSRFIASTANSELAGVTAQIFLLRPPDIRLSHPSTAFRVSLSPDGNRAAMAHMYRSVSIWDANTGETLAYLDGHYRWVSEVFWGHDGKRLYSGSADKTVRIWDAEKFTEIRRLTNSTAAIFGIAVSPDEHWLAAMDTTGRAHLWELPEARYVRSWQVYTNRDGDHYGPLHLRFDPNSRWLALGALHAQSGVWDVTTGRRIVQFSTNDAVSVVPIGMAWSADGSQFAFCDFSGLLRIWDTGSWKELRAIQTRSAGTQILFSPAGDRLFLSTSEAGHSNQGDAGVDIYDAHTGQFLVRMGKRQGNSLSLRASDDGMRIARCLWANAPNMYGADIWDALPWHDSDYPGLPGEPLEERVEQFARDRNWKSEARVYERKNKGLADYLWHPPSSDWPARLPNTPPGCIDLTEQYNGHLDVSFEFNGNWDQQENNLQGLPQGIVTLDGVVWDIRGVLALARTGLPSLGYYWPTPHGILGIRVGQKCKRLHFLHGAMDLWTDFPSIGRYRLHYADGTTHDLMLQPGIDIGHWWTQGEMCKATAASKAWEGENVASKDAHARTVLFHRAWENPFPDKVIETIDFLSDERRPVPFLVALTVE